MDVFKAFLFCIYGVVFCAVSSASAGEPQLQARWFLCEIDSDCEIIRASLPCGCVAAINSEFRAEHDEAYAAYQMTIQVSPDKAVLCEPCYGAEIEWYDARCIESRCDAYLKDDYYKMKSSAPKN